MPAFSSDGNVSAPTGTAWLEFFNADKDNWTANVYKTEDCGGGREFSHGSVVAALPDGSFPPVFLWDAISYRVIAKDASGATLGKIDRVTPNSEWDVVTAPVVEAAPVVPEPAPVDLAAENEALRHRVAALEAILAPEEHKFPASLDEKLSDYAPVEEVLKTDDLLMMSRENPIALEQTVQRLDRLKRKKFFELLNVELAELQQERGGPREDLKRESEIESLLGLFARVGEM